MRGIKEKRATRSDGAVNKCTLGVNKVTSCLQRAVMHSSVSPKAPKSLGIVWIRSKGSIIDMLCTRYTCAVAVGKEGPNGDNGLSLRARKSTQELVKELPNQKHVSTE